MSAIFKRVLTRLPGLRRLPMFKVLAIAEIAILARAHVTRLDGAERRRFLQLLRKGRGRTTALSTAEGAELSALVAKLQPRLFAGMVADKLSPVPLPRRVVQGPRSKRDEA